jgi:hypothetical protein
MSQATHDWMYQAVKQPSRDDPYNKQQWNKNAQRRAEDRQRYMDDLLASMLGKRP